MSSCVPSSILEVSRLEIDGATDDRLSVAYTAIYRLCLQPNVISDAGEKPRYSTFSLWDTFRAAHPLYTLLFPEMVEPFVDSILEHARRDGWLPLWEIWGREGFDMIGNHSVPVLLDAYRKGFRFDAK